MKTSEKKQRGDYNPEIEEKERPLSFMQGMQLLGLSASYGYKLTSEKKIPHYKPFGKKIFFKESELIAWAFENRIQTQQELEQKAVDYITNSK
jgi:excisionase family DNA binding protein